MKRMDVPTLGLLKAGMVHQNEGQFLQAVEQFRAAVARNPLSIPARHALAVALHRAGMEAEAIREFDIALKEAGEDPVLLANRASALMALGRMAEAEQSCRQALLTQPNNFSALFNLGVILEKSGRTADAMTPLRAALDIRPDASNAARALARVAVAMNDAGAAHRVLPALASKAVGHDLLLVGELYRVCSDLESAWRAWREAAIDPNLSARARLRICRTSLSAGRPDIAQMEAETVLRSDPTSRNAMLLHAVALHESGCVEEAICDYRKLLQTHPDFGEAESNYLIALQHAPETTPAEIFHASEAWARRHAPADDWASGGGGHRTRLRVIWVSPRFSHGPVETFFAAVLAAMREHKDIEHTLVMTGFENDAGTARFRALADRWIDASRMSDDHLLHLLRQINADVAVDLAGHAPRNRLRLFARRIAPRQFTWLDNFSTTGIPAMDAFLSDAVLTPPGMDDQFTERVVRLPLGRLAYSPPDLRVAMQPLDEHPRSRLLVCFNRMAKVTSTMLDTWARILVALPDWRLLLRNSAVVSPQVRARVIAALARHGVSPDRVEMEGFGTYAETMDRYGRADIALDTYPFGGCATTCDALWMGVPVVTLRGSTLVSRQSSALLEQCGLAHWVASSADEYVEIARHLAIEDASSRVPRASLRERVRTRLGDAEGFARSLLQTISS